MYDYGIFIFRRDLRIIDNQGLVLLSGIVKEIIPVFIFDTNQIKKTQEIKKYMSNPALQFICESIDDLNNSLHDKLHIFYGDPVKTIANILKNTIFKNKSIVFGFNEDFTKYSIERDNNIKEFLNNNNIDIITCDYDFTLCDMKYLVKNDDTAFKQYSAFRRNLILNKNNFTEINNKKIKFINKKIIFNNLIDNYHSFYKNPDYYNPQISGNRKDALKILNNIIIFKDYNNNRDLLDYNTTHLSAYLNFGLISEREFYNTVYNKINKNSLLLNQIIWRDYYLTMLRFQEGAQSYEKHMDNRYNKLKWLDYFNNDNDKYKTKRHQQSYDEWKIMMSSSTGFLLIDAAIQEILITGYMHNRCRLLVGYFCTKYLLINPLTPVIGLMSWFSRYLIDCITSQNKLNAQFITELDLSGKKFSKKVIDGRPMSPSNEMIKKYDPECLYIKKWLPNLKNIDNKILSKWEKMGNNEIHPLPIFDPKIRYLEWIGLCGNVI
jgi:deoxyribodipyrimidine photo-lyase